MPNEFDTNKNQLDLFSYAESKQNQQDKRQKLASSGFTATVWTLSGVVLAACSLFQDDEGPGGESVSVLASPVEGARLYFDINGDGIVNEEDVRIQNEQYPGGFITGPDGRETGIPLELHGRPYIALLDGATDEATGQALEGQVSSLEDEDGNHLIASPITDLITDAIADPSLPNTVSGVVAEFTPIDVDGADILAELRNRDSYLPGTEHSPRIVAASKYLADNQAKEVLGRGDTDTIVEQILKVQRIIDGVDDAPTLAADDTIVVFDGDDDIAVNATLTFTVGEHDTYIGLVNAYSRTDGATLTYEIVDPTTNVRVENGDYTINPRGVISAVTQAGQTSPRNTDGDTLRISINDGTNTEYVDVTITVNPAHELVILQEDGTATVTQSVESAENSVGVDVLEGIQVDVDGNAPAPAATDFVIRDAFPEDFDSLADKFEIVASTATPDTWKLKLKTGEFLDYEATRTFDLHVSVANSAGDHSNELTITVMVGNVDDISFSGTLRADLREDDTTPPSTHLIAEGQVQIANQDLGGSIQPVVLSSTLLSTGMPAPASGTTVETLTLDHGTFTYNHADNAWTYTVNNDAAAIQALVFGQATTEIVTLTIADPTDPDITYTQSIVLNVHGANEDVRFEDANDVRTSIANVPDAMNIEIGDEMALNGSFALGNVLTDLGVTLEGRLSESETTTVAFADSVSAEVRALFDLTPSGVLTFTGTSAQALAQTVGTIPLNLLVSTESTADDIPLTVRVNIVNLIDNDGTGSAIYEIDGDTSAEGNLLTAQIAPGGADVDGVMAGSERYQWYRGDDAANGVLVGSGSTYTVQTDDVDETITLVVNYTDGSGTPETSEAATTPVRITRPTAAELEFAENDGTASLTLSATSSDDTNPSVAISTFMFVYTDQQGAEQVESDYQGFSINNQGVITLTGGTALDYETASSYDLRIRATDANNEVGHLSITIRVGDVNDNAPVFDPNQVTTVAIDETLGNGQSVGLSVAATDADGTTANSTVTYSVTGGTGMGIFDVDSSSGVITVLDASMIDYESGTTSYTLIIGASDGLDASGTDDPTFTADTTTTITINISDVNDIVPTYTTSGSPSVRTTADPAVDPLVSATPTGYSITITDADAGNDFEGNFNLNDPRFEFQDQGNGVWNLVLRANQDITEEAGDTITLTYQVHDGTNIAETNPPAQPGTVTIAVVDSSVSFDAGFDRDYDIPETTSYTAGELVVQVSATSVTPGNPDIRYSFEQGNPDNALFNIDATTGRITWAANTAFDYEALTADERIGQVVVIATEVAGSGDTNAGTGNTARVTITGTVMNEQEGDGTYIVRGNVAAGAELTAEVTDPDGTRSVTYEWYSIDPANSNARTVLGATQSITLPEAPNFDDSLTYHVDIVHIDNLGDRHEETLDASAVQFNIQKTLTDNTAFPDSIAENTDSLPVVVATLDGDTRSPTYTFVGGDTITTSGVFTISQSGSTAGAITVNAPSDINFETAQEFNDGSRGYTLNVRATFAEDTTNNLPEVTGDVVVTIIVTDVNEHAPVFVTNADDNTLSTGTEEIAEDAANGARVGLFRATDADGSNNDVTYSLDDGGLGVFGIREVTGTNNWEIYVLNNANLDYDPTTTKPTPTRSYTIEITATDSDPDNAMSSAAEAFTINITDVNDNDPVLGAPVWRSTYETSVPEDTGSGVHLFTVTATDADTATTPPPTLTYRIVTIDDVAYDSATAIFGINGSNGEVGIALDNALDRETKASHKIVIEAFDEGVRTSNQQTVIVTVGDVNEHKPVLGEPEWVSDYGDNGVPEDAYTGAPLQIFTATATDRDATNNGFSYEIVSVDGVTYDSSTSIFAIRAGRVGITSALDYATAPEIMDDTNTVIGRGHEIVIVAIDNSGTGMRSEPGTITVLVANRDDGPAVFEVSPTQANKDILEVEVDTADPDGLNGTYSYQWFTTTDDGVTQTDITGENGRRFDTSGRTDPTGTVYGVRVEYTDNAGTEYSQANGNAPFAVNTTLRFTESYSITLTDGNASPTLPVFKDDLELNGDAITTGLEFTFATDGNPGNLFTLSSAGELTFTGSAVDFDMATDAQKSFNLLIVAEATAGGETTTAIIPVTVEDVNDNDPTLSEPFDTASAASDPRTALSTDDIDENATGAATSISFEASDADTVFSGAGQTELEFTITATAGTTDAQDIADMFEMAYDAGEDIYTLRLKDGMALNAEAAGLTTNGGVQQIELRIQATDGRTDMPTATPTAGQGLSDARTVTITVNDINEFGPVFDAGDAQTQKANFESASAGGTVANAPATDGDATAANRVLTYSIVDVSGGGGGFFKLDDDQTANPGRIVLTQALDYESAPELMDDSNTVIGRGYVINLLAEDQDGLQARQKITVLIDDEDDTPSEFGTLTWNAGGDDPSDPGSRLIDENTTGTLLTIPISDSDTAGGTLAVRIVSGNSVEGGEDLFVFAKNTANTAAELSINPNRVLNYEDGTTYTLVLEVSDGTNTPAATQTVTINVNNLNDETPAFADPVVTWEAGFTGGVIPETTDGSTTRVLVGRVAITDGDGTAFLDDRTFAINGAGTKFVIERDTTTGEGLIYLTAALDREGTDPDPAQITGVTITVDDDGNGANAAVTSSAFNIQISDANDEPTVIGATKVLWEGPTVSGTIPENSYTAGTEIAKAIVSDADASADLEYRLTKGGSTFSIGSTDGIITFTADTDLDADTAPTSYTLAYEVRDRTGAWESSGDITLTVTGIDDEKPELGTLTWQAGTGSGVAGEEHIRTIAENQGSAPILVMSVSDPDTATASLTPTIQGGSPVDASNNPIFSFGILNNQAILSVLSSRLDYETAPNTYTLTLVVTDGTRTDTQTVVINVGNVNEHGPAFGTELVDFGTGFSNGIIPEDTAEGTVIGVVDVSDADGDVLTVTVLPDQGATQDLADKFEVVYNMMDTQYELRLKTALDLEGATPDPTAPFGLRLRATDGTNSVDSPADTGSLIVISIGNVDDADPVFNDTHIIWNVGALNIKGVDANTIAVFEYVVDGTTTSGAPAGRKLADLAASDPDTSGTLTYGIDNGPQIGGVDIFEIGGANNDELLLKTPLDYEHASVGDIEDDMGNVIARGYTLTLTASDGRSGANPVSHKVVIRVLNADEGKAIFAPLTSSGDVTAPAVGDELTFTPTPTTADPDGNPVAPNTFTRTWYRENPDGTGLDTITNASDTYTITSADVGKIVGVIVNYIDGGGTEYLGTAGVRVELANVVVSDFEVTGGTSGMAEQYDASAVDATGTLMFGTASAAKVNTAGTYTIVTDGTYGTAEVVDGVWTYNVDNTNATIKALASGATQKDTFTIGVPLTGGTTQNVDVTVTITGRTDSETRGDQNTNKQDTIDSASAPNAVTTFEVIQGGNDNDTIKAGSGGSLIIAGYGEDTITLSEADGVMDVVVYRFRSDDTAGGWRAADGADEIHNFELGVDKIVFVDIDTTSQVDSLEGFLAKTNDAVSAGDGALSFLYTLRGTEAVTGVEVGFGTQGGSTGPTEADGVPSGAVLKVLYKNQPTLAQGTDRFWEGQYFDAGTGNFTPSLDTDSAILDFSYAPNAFRGTDTSFDGLEVIGSLTDLGIDIL